MLPLPLHDSRSSVGHTAGAITGCGTEVHPTVSTSGRKLWTVRSERILPTVVPLASEYLLKNKNDNSVAFLERKNAGVGPRASGAAYGLVWESTYFEPGVITSLIPSGNTLGVRKTYCPGHQSPNHTASYLFLAGSVSPPLSRRQRKFPTTNDEATPTLAAATGTHPRFDLASWLSESYERHPAPSPTPSELQDITRQMDSESSERDDEQAAAAARLHGGVGSTPENSAVGSAAMAIPNTLDRNNSGVRVHFDR
ncbi:hypothetical protein C8F04DRAFT_1352736 [Mycena alexandri]|uniref:Uncharacterized protein n=1 Tax=Mycena alexandri TaxID=1745969 RepID=A0AAD6SVE8_9AGAR|nr:hypothetical protein C8F04DRAFT_1352736 [Mycena alexandri]